MRVEGAASQSCNAYTRTARRTEHHLHTCCKTTELLYHQTLILSPGHVETSRGKKSRNSLREVMCEARKAVNRSPGRP